MPVPVNKPRRKRIHHTRQWNRFSSFRYRANTKGRIRLHSFAADLRPSADISENVCYSIHLNASRISIRSRFAQTIIRIIRMLGRNPTETINYRMYWMLHSVQRAVRICRTSISFSANLLRLSPIALPGRYMMRNVHGVSSSVSSRGGRLFSSSLGESDRIDGKIIENEKKKLNS